MQTELFDLELVGRSREATHGCDHQLIIQSVQNVNVIFKVAVKVT